jgi:hypothetical protein
MPKIRLRHPRPTPSVEPNLHRVSARTFYAIEYDLFVQLETVAKALLGDYPPSTANAEVAFAYEKARRCDLLLPQDEGLAIEAVMRFMVDRLRARLRRDAGRPPAPSPWPPEHFDPRPPEWRRTFAQRHFLRSSDPERLFWRAGPMLETLARILLGPEHANEAVPVVGSVRMNVDVGLLPLSADPDEAVAQLVRNVVFVVDFVYPPESAEAEKSPAKAA